MEYVFKTACPACGKPKALKTIAWIVGKTVHTTTSKCHKCGFVLGTTPAIRTSQS